MYNLYHVKNINESMLDMIRIGKTIMQDIDMYKWSSFCNTL